MIQYNNRPPIIKLFPLIFTALLANVNSPVDAKCNFNIINQNIISRMKLGSSYKTGVNCSCCSTEDHQLDLADTLKEQFAMNYYTGSFVLRIISIDRHIAEPSRISQRASHHHEEKCNQKDESLCSALDFDIPMGYGSTETTFWVQANQVGRAAIKATIIWWNSSTVPVDSRGNTLPPDGELHEDEVKITVIRKHRAFYTAYDYSALFIACMTALTVGCCTDLEEMKKNMRTPIPIVAALFCQHIAMPCYTFGVNAALGMENDLAYGLFVTATVPGGGLAHLVVFLMDGDKHMSAAISILNTLLNMIISPIWLFSLSWYFGETIHIGMYLLWLSPSVLAHMAGIVIRYLNIDVSDAIMTWFTRPILLLSGILLVTLGVYINHYAFHYIDKILVTALLLTIFGGFCLGGLFAIIAGQSRPVRKTFAAEASVFNCLLIIPALRASMSQPQADLAATLPLWGVFFTPAPILLYFVGHKVKKTTLNFVKKRKEKQYRQYSIVSSLGKMTQEVGAVSTQMVKDNADFTDSTTLPTLEKQEKTTSL